MHLSQLALAPDSINCRTPKLGGTAGERQRNTATIIIKTRSVVQSSMRCRVLQDAGLQVSAVKVNRRQSLDLAQSAQSPYSGRSADEDISCKRKGVVKSASFTSSSNDSATRCRRDSVSASTGNAQARAFIACCACHHRHSSICNLLHHTSGAC